MPHKPNYSVASFYGSSNASEAGSKKLVEVEGRGHSSFADYAQQGGFFELKRLLDEATPIIDVLTRILASGLRGCGGSHIPLIKKWEAVIPAHPQYLVVNGLEGEPFTFKDYFLMLYYPQVLLEGIAITCRVLHIHEVYLVINAAYSQCHQVLEASLREHAELFAGIKIHLVSGPEVDLYVVGEETALLNYLEGKRGEPRLKPPFPHQQGLWAKPTLIHNVETLSWIPILLNRPQRFVKQHPKLVTLLGDVRYPGIYECNLGDPLRELIQQAEVDDLSFVEIGGISGGLIPADLIDVAYDDEALSKLGVQVGSGTLRIFNSGHDPLEEMSRSTEYFMAESCGRCTPCRVGTQELAKFAGALREKSETDEGLNWLHSVAHTMQQTSTCGLGRAAPVPLLTYLHHFRKQSHD
jgi:NADH:ubiquinone oxidoreductase subunit F (NADH-binding)